MGLKHKRELLGMDMVRQVDLSSSVHQIPSPLLPAGDTRESLAGHHPHVGPVGLHRAGSLHTALCTPPMQRRPDLSPHLPIHMCPLRADDCWKLCDLCRHLLHCAEFEEDRTTGEIGMNPFSPTL